MYKSRGAGDNFASLLKRGWFSGFLVGEMFAVTVGRNECRLFSGVVLLCAGGSWEQKYRMDIEN